MGEREYGMKEQKIANTTLREATALQGVPSLTKQYGDTLKNVLPRMSSESAELPAYFDTDKN